MDQFAWFLSAIEKICVLENSFSFPSPAFVAFLKRFFAVKAYSVQIRQSSPGSQCPVSKLCPPYDFRYTKNMALSSTTNSTVTSTTETGEISFKLLFPS